MQTILAHAHSLMYTILALMPTHYQRDSLEAMLGLFLEAQGKPLPHYSKTKSESALSRFLNHYNWSTRQIIRHLRAFVIELILSQCTRGRKPFLQVIIDVTTLEKTGKFKAFKHLITFFNHKRGLHLVVLYLVVGQWRIPWNFRVWRGKGTTTPAQLALKMVRRLPKKLTRHFQVKILADTAFGTVEFIHGIRQLKYHAILGISCNRKLVDGRSVKDLYHRGQQVRLVGLDVTVTVSWYYLKTAKGTFLKRYVISTTPLKAATISWWGKRRWQIEGWFKTAKHRFGLDKFGQCTLLGIYRWLILSLTAFLLAHWAYLARYYPHPLDWGQAAFFALSTFFPVLLLSLLLLDIERLRPLALSHGIDITISRCKI
jgi:DDE superfamily endonuclease